MVDSKVCTILMNNGMCCFKLKIIVTSSVLAVSPLTCDCHCLIFSLVHHMLEDHPLLPPGPSQRLLSGCPASFSNGIRGLGWLSRFSPIWPCDLGCSSLPFELWFPHVGNGDKCEFLHLPVFLRIKAAHSAWHRVCPS